MSTLKTVAIYSGIFLTSFYVANAIFARHNAKPVKDEPNPLVKEKTIHEHTWENCASEGEWPLSEEKEMLKKEFEEAFYAIEKEVPFKDIWHNGTGYLDGGVRDNSIGLKEGERARSIDPLTSRKIIIIGVKNRGGVITNCLHFERNVPGKGSYCIVSNYDCLDNVPKWK